MAEIPDDDSSSSKRTVVLRDWWLIKCSKEFEGKRFGVAGNEISETRAVRLFTSSPIIKALDVFTLQASDGISIILRGFLNKQRLVQSGFLSQISREFIFGFPPCWEALCNNCFVGLPSGTASRTFLSPCNNTKWNLEDNPAETRDESTVIEKNIEEIIDKDGCSGGSIVRDKRPATKKSLSLQSKSVVVSKVQNTTNDGTHGSAEAKSGGVEKDECNESKVQKRTNGGDHDSQWIYNEEIPPVDGCGKLHSGTNSKKITSKNATKESLTSGQPKGKLKVTKASLQSLSNSSKPGKKGKSKKSEKILKGDSDVVEPMTPSGSKVKHNLSVRKTNRKIDFDEEVTSDKDLKKQKTSAVSSDSLGQRRSRSGRVLVSALEYWRNQVPVYDVDRNLIQVNEGHETKNSTPPKGKGSRLSKVKKMKIK